MYFEDLTPYSYSADSTPGRAFNVVKVGSAEEPPIRVPSPTRVTGSSADRGVFAHRSPASQSQLTPNCPQDNGPPERPVLCSTA
jgi:hypothetical protein